jgi:hypothetical protein
MATTSTYNFAPSTGDLVLNAYGRIQIRRTELTQQHLADAANEANLLQVEFASRQPNLWTSELEEVTLTAGQAEYTLDSTIICFMAVYLRMYDSSNTPIDRIMAPLSTYEYSALPNKTTQAPPNQYWFNRQVIPTITLWPVPDDSTPYTLELRYLKQIEDASLVNGTTPQMPYRFMDAFTAGLAARLAEIYPDSVTKAKGPTAVADMHAKAERAWMIAAKEDSEDVPIYITPGLAGYCY